MRWPACSQATTSLTSPGGASRTNSAARAARSLGGRSSMSDIGVEVGVGGSEAREGARPGSRPPTSRAATNRHS